MLYILNECCRKLVKKGEPLAWLEKCREDLYIRIDTINMKTFTAHTNTFCTYLRGHKKTQPLGLLAVGHQ